MYRGNILLKVIFDKDLLFVKSNLFHPQKKFSFSLNLQCPVFFFVYGVITLNIGIKQACLGQGIRFIQYGSLFSLHWQSACFDLDISALCSTEIAYQRRLYRIMKTAFICFGRFFWRVILGILNKWHQLICPLRMQVGCISLPSWWPLWQMSWAFLQTFHKTRLLANYGMIHTGR